MWPTAWRRIPWTAAYSRARGLRPSNGDGLDIAVDDGRIVGVRGRVTDRVNHGRLDPKDCSGGTNAGRNGRAIAQTCPTLPSGRSAK